MTKHQLLVYTAKLYEGVKEERPNKGPLIEIFQRSTGAIHQAWCASFVLHCVNKVDDLFTQYEYGPQQLHGLLKTPSVLTLWHRSQHKIVPEPFPGCFMAWQMGETQAGHIGIVTGIIGDNLIETIEGNTSEMSSVDREGEGVFSKIRKREGSLKMKVLGFIDPWR